MEDKNVYEYLSEVAELQAMAEFVKDDMVDDALNIVVKLVRKDELPSSALAGPMIVRLQAMAAQASLKAKYYTVFEKGGDNVKKKHVYYTLEAALNNIVNSLKYLVK